MTSENTSGKRSEVSHSTAHNYYRPFNKKRIRKPPTKDSYENPPRAPQMLGRPRPRHPKSFRPSWGPGPPCQAGGPSLQKACSFSFLKWLQKTISIRRQVYATNTYPWGFKRVNRTYYGLFGATGNHASKISES